MLADGAATLLHIAGGHYHGNLSVPLPTSSWCPTHAPALSVSLSCCLRFQFRVGSLLTSCAGFPYAKISYRIVGLHTSTTTRASARGLCAALLDAGGSCADLRRRHRLLAHKLTLNRLYGPYTIWSLQKDMACCLTFEVHVALKVETHAQARSFRFVGHFVRVYLVTFWGMPVCSLALSHTTRSRLVRQSLWDHVQGSLSLVSRASWQNQSILVPQLSSAGSS